MADIAIRGARKSFGKTEVIKKVDLSIADGAFAVILGPSGCGKSTLLRMIAGLEAIDAGEIAIAGKVVNALEPRERGCAMVFQNYALYPHMTVARNIGYGLEVAGVPKAERTRRIEEVARTVGLSDFLERRPAQLSGGQRQRVAMARAMIKEPAVFLFDEPLSNLDAKLRVQMRVEIKKLHQRLGATSVFVTHDQIEAMTLADLLVVMNDGHLEQVGVPREVYRMPATRFVAGFLGSPPMNMLPAKVAKPGTAVLADGFALPIDPALDVAAGQAIDVGVRPEDLVVDGAAGHALPPMPVEFVEELGAGILAHGPIAGHDCVVHLPATRAVAPGETLAPRFAPEALHVFDQASGRRIARRVGAGEAASAVTDRVAAAPAA